MIPLFSCVMPVKGARPYMKEALASLAAQGLGDELEVIVQDGDLEPDKGQSDALNRGFAKARGEWLFWLNADDVLLPGALKSVKCKIENVKCRSVDAKSRSQEEDWSAEKKSLRDLDWIVGNQMRIDDQGKVLRCSVGNGWHDWLYRHAVPHVFGPSAFFRRELLERAGWLDPSLHICMDWDLWIRFMQAGARFARIDQYLWGLRQWTGSKTQRPMAREELAHQHEEVVRMLEKNKFALTRGGMRMVRLWRALNGSYLTEWVDGLRFRGRDVSSCVN